jgi:sugar phosphate isomerase/epimerase
MSFERFGQFSGPSNDHIDKENRMFKIAVFTDEISQDFERAVLVAQEYALDGVEIRSVWDKPPHMLDNNDVRDLREILRGTKLKVASIASPFFKCDLTKPEERTQHLEILRRCCALADALECKIIRGFTFWRSNPVDDHWTDILAAFDEPVTILQKYDMTLAIENEASTMIGTGRRLARFLDDLGSQRVAAMWDPANCIYDEDEVETPFPDGYAAIKNRMPHMHLKDALRDPVTKLPVCVPIGEGAIDFRGQFKALVADNYTGYVSLETHWRPTALNEDQMNKPGGAAFSKEGEYASRVCLENLHRILKELGLR